MKEKHHFRESFFHSNGKMHKKCRDQMGIADNFTNFYRISASYKFNRLKFHKVFFHDSIDKAYILMYK